LNSVILDRDKENVIISVRVEFPLKLKVDLEKLEDKIKRSLKEFNVVEGPYFNEQSDKEHVFITLKVETKENWKKLNQKS
jgi:tRNA(Glu) U13 pseudouridine synthase TruD